jgi:hypothetical protein
MVHCSARQIINRTIPAATSRSSAAARFTTTLLRQHLQESCSMHIIANIYANHPAALILISLYSTQILNCWWL